MRSSNLVVLAVFVPFFSFSQSNAKAHSSPSFYAIGSVGMIAGQSEVKPAYQVVGGLTYNRYAAGFGIGIDEYRFRSIPLFADMRVSFTRKQLAFVYADAGYNFPSHIKSENEGFTTTDEYSGGLYLDLGIGYKIRLGKFNRLLFSSGYTNKEINNTVGYTYPCLIGPCNEDIYHYRYRLSRITARLSWEIGRGTGN